MFDTHGLKLVVNNNAQPLAHRDALPHGEQTRRFPRDEKKSSWLPQVAILFLASAAPLGVEPNAPGFADPRHRRMQEPKQLPSL